MPNIRQSTAAERCPEQLRTLGDALLLYLADHDLRLPLADRWATDLSAYTHSQRPFSCPKIDLDGKREYGHAYVRSLSGLDIGNLGDLSAVPAIYDSTDRSWNAAGTPSGVPDGVCNVANLDGSVGTLRKK